MFIQKLQQGFNTCITTSVLLCIFGFLKEIRPSEPFNYEFLIGVSRNLTDVQVIQQVYPIGTLSYLVQLSILFLIADLCRYKPIMVLSGTAGITVWGMYLWTKSLEEIQITQIMYGTFCASEVAYFTCIYANVDFKKYKLLSSHCKIAVFAGQAFSGILSQIIVSFSIMNYRQLNYITFAAMLGLMLWSLILPCTEKSIYFHQHPAAQLSICERNKLAYSSIWQDLLNAYSNKYILKWCVWWILASCGFFQTRAYIQPLWSDIANDHNQTLYNAAAESLFTISSFLGSSIAGMLRIDWTTKGELSLTCCSLLQGFALLILSQAANIKVGYTCYIVFGGLFNLMITIANSEIAHYIKENSYGLIYFFNTFVALIFQSLLITLVVTNQIGFALSPRKQYFVYGLFHTVLACSFIIIGFCGWLASKKDYRKTSIATQPVIIL
ncbi:thiamine transporter 2-like [Cylas formicarius]|uniref:thiamine transporter 2-like n=1 Tax=Cylas formicarius TaxID=197179 RepID=UPI002958CFE0|nr:thiamine transporter 2-like [Cylas formicarius]